MEVLRVFAGLGLVFALAACGPQPATTKANPESSGHGTVVNYATNRNKDGFAVDAVEITKLSDLSKLRAAPNDFVDFIGEYWSSLKADLGEDPSCPYPTIGVEGIDTKAGVALGSVNNCSGWEALWIRWNGRWLEADGTQMGWSCEQLEKWRVPKELAPATCGVMSGQAMKTLHYGGPGPVPAGPQQLPGKRTVYMETLDTQSHGTDGAFVDFEHKPAQVLKGQPASFIKFVDGFLDQGCGVMVDGIDPSLGIATGSVTDCADPHASIWIYWNHSWIEAATSDERWACQTLKTYRVPDVLTGSTCTDWNDAGEQAVGYEGQ